MDTSEVWGEEDAITAEVSTLTPAELRMRTSLVDSELKYFKSEANKLKFELNNMQVIRTNAPTPCKHLIYPVVPYIRYL